MALAMGVATLFSCSDDDKSAAATGVQVTSAESTIYLRLSPSKAIIRCLFQS